MSFVYLYNFNSILKLFLGKKRSNTIYSTNSSNTSRAIDNNENDVPPKYEDLIQQNLPKTIQLDKEVDRPMPVLPATFV